MLKSFLQRLRLVARKLWVRVVLISVLSIVAVLASKLIGPFLPDGLDRRIGAQSVDQLLDILSSSMLAVTTFSLSVMVSVHRSVSSQWTPRAHRVQLRDQGTQITLATFVGAFVYALCSIVLRSASAFSDRDIVVLFAMTLVVIVLVVVMLVRWLLRLQTMGSLADTAGRITDLTRRAYTDRMAHPCLGARRLDPDLVLPPGTRDLRADRSGYVLRIFPSAIDERAEGCGGRAYLLKGVGDYVNRGEVIAHITDPVLEDSIRGNVQIGSMRDIEQDPGFGLHVLAEIASKALSPGVNDGGTAIDMIDRMTGILDSVWEAQDAPAHPPIYPNLYLPPLHTGAMVTRPFGLIARDGAAVLEVQMVLQSRLAALAKHPDPGIASAAAALRDTALQRALAALPHQVDRDVLADHAAALTKSADPAG